MSRCYFCQCGDSIVAEVVVAELQRRQQLEGGQGLGEGAEVLLVISRDFVVRKIDGVYVGVPLDDGGQVLQTLIVDLVVREIDLLQRRVLAQAL